MHFTFEHDCATEPFYLTIEVSYSVFTHPGSYDTPSECSINDLTYTIKCGSIDMTKFITQDLYATPFSNEVLQTIEEKVWEHYETI